MNDELQGTEGIELVVRQAQLEDAMDVFRWRNDPLVCAVSRQHETISEAEHMTWYSRALDDPNRLLFIGILEGKKIGIVRFDNRLESVWEVSINVASKVRGRGLGQCLLRVALRHLYRGFPLAFVLAVARLNNQSSLKLFHAVGFDRASDDGVFVSLVLTPVTTKLVP